MWCLPTHKRPEKLMRLVRSLEGSDQGEHVIVLIWRHDPRMNDYAVVFRDLPRSWDVWLTEERWCGEKLNLAFDRFPDETFYGLLTDDIQLRTPSMMARLAEEARAGRFAWPNDSVHGPRAATHPCAPGKLLRALGFWAHPQYPHNYLDTILYRVATAVGLTKYRSDLFLDTNHPDGNWRHPEWDETYADAVAENARAQRDFYRFESEELPKLIQQVKDVYAQRVAA